MDMFAALNAFVAVVEEGGFAPAGRILSLATSSVTRQIDALETSLGIKLFTRSTRNVSLTTAGQDYFEHAVRIISDLESANQEARDQGGEPRGRLRISLPVSYSRLHIASLLASFSRQYPLITLDLTFTDDVVDLVEKRLDLSIRLGDVESPNLIVRRLHTQRRLVCASPDFLAQQGSPRAPEDLVRFNCLLFSYSSGRTRWYFSGAKQESINVQGTLKCNNADVLREAVLSGYGIALLPDWLVRQDIAAGKLVQILTDWRADVSADRKDSAIYAIYHPSRRNTRKVKVFVDFLVSHLSHTPED